MKLQQRFSEDNFLMICIGWVSVKRRKVITDAVHARHHLLRVLPLGAA